MAAAIWRRGRVAPAVALLVAIGLLVSGLVLAGYNEQSVRAQKSNETQVQSQILADSLTAAVTFDDRETVREFVTAERSNPDLEAVGVYDAKGALVAGYARPGAGALPETTPTRRGFEGRRLVVVAPITQNGEVLGAVYLRAMIEPVMHRIARYAGAAALVVMAALVVIMFGAANASLAEAHRALKAEMVEREKAEAALLQSQKMEAMGQLTGGVAHDFNNLLMVASSGMDLLERTEDPARRERLKDGIRQAIERGASLTQQLLAFSRRSPLQPEVIDLAVQIDGMGVLLDRSLREDIGVDLQMAPDLWPVEVDPAQLEVAILNIALNARDAMASGGRILIAAENAPDFHDGRLSGDFVRLAIRDTGVGVPQENLDRLFEPFFTTKGVGKGTGLGLSQVYGFTRASGGTVIVESQEGEGTTISLLIPRSLKSVPVAAAPPPPQPAASDQRRILLVEDDNSVAELVGEMLQELGYGALRAENAKAALEALEREDGFDLVFSDMVMPGEMSGIDLAREIGRRRPNLPVLLTTGFSEAAAAATADGLRLLVKPYRIDRLAAELKATLAQR